MGHLGLGPSVITFPTPGATLDVHNFTVTLTDPGVNSPWRADTCAVGVWTAVPGQPPPPELQQGVVTYYYGGFGPTGQCSIYVGELAAGSHYVHATTSHDGWESSGPTVTFTASPGGVVIQTPPMYPSPTITNVKTSGTGSTAGFEVLGCGFQKSKNVSIRVADDAFHQGSVVQTSDPLGNFDARLNFACNSTLTLTFSASDDGGAHWSNYFKVPCP
ncbi:MAG: hypothetical protein QM778_18425 [Myxococcales bacterium]